MCVCVCEDITFVKGVKNLAKPAAQYMYNIINTSLAALQEKLLKVLHVGVSEPAKKPP